MGTYKVGRRRALLTGVVGLGVVVASCNISPQLEARISRALSLMRRSAAPGQTLTVYQDRSVSNYSGFSAVAWSPAGKYIAAGGLGHHAELWDAVTGSTYQTIQATTESASLCWSPDGRYLALGGGDYTPADLHLVWVWDTRTSSFRVKYAGHHDHINAVAWSPDGSRIASASNDQTVQVWDALSGRHLLTYTAHHTLISYLSWSPDSQFIVSATSDLLSGIVSPTVRVWNSHTGEDVVAYKGWADAVAWSPASATIAMGDYQGMVYLRDAMTAKVRSSYKAGSAAILALAWSPHGAHLAAAGGSTQSYEHDGFAQVRTLAAGQTLAYHGHTLAVLSASWSPDGSRIVTSSYDKTAKVWQALS